MPKDKIVCNVFETCDYSKFKRLEGNRTDIERRAKKVRKSVHDVGQIRAPIIVNEKLEVIDGQARLEAFREMGLPIYYTIVDGIGMDECTAMNINQSNWTLFDFIQSYAELGNVSYKYLLNLYKAFGRKYQSKVILCAITGRIDVQAIKVKNEEITCSADDYNRAVVMLTWLEKFIPIIRRVGGHTEFYYLALMFCYDDMEVDNDRLFQKMEQRQGELIPVTTSLQAFDVIEKIYNHSARKCVYIKTNYRKALEDKYPWYGNKWGKNYTDNKTAPQVAATTTGAGDK